MLAEWCAIDPAAHGPAPHPPVLRREPHSSRRALLRQRKIRGDGHFVMVAGTAAVVNDAWVSAAEARA